MIISDYRLNELRQGVWGHLSCVQDKTPYRKRKTDYWEGGGIQAVRKQQYTESVADSEN